MLSKRVFIFDVHFDLEYGVTAGTCRITPSLRDTLSLKATNQTVICIFWLGYFNFGQILHIDPFSCILFNLIRLFVFCIPWSFRNCRSVGCPICLPLRRTVHKSLALFIFVLLRTYSPINFAAFAHQ